MTKYDFAASVEQKKPYKGEPVKWFYYLEKKQQNWLPYVLVETTNKDPKVTFKSNVAALRDALDTLTGTNIPSRSIPTGDDKFKNFMAPKVEFAEIQQRWGGFIPTRTLGNSTNKNAPPPTFLGQPYSENCMNFRFLQNVLAYTHTGPGILMIVRENGGVFSEVNFQVVQKALCWLSVSTMKQDVIALMDHLLGLMSVQYDEKCGPNWLKYFYTEDKVKKTSPGNLFAFYYTIRMFATNQANMMNLGEIASTTGKRSSLYQVSVVSAVSDLVV